MKDILIVAPFTGSLQDHNSRFHYLSEKLVDKDVNVELITSIIHHNTKMIKKADPELLKSFSYKFTMLEEPGYKRNVSMKRLYSHYIFGYNLAKYLKTRKKPDVIYCAIPSIDAARVAAKYAKKHKIRFIIDVQDLWPEAFKLAFNVPILSDILFFPMKLAVNKVYSTADAICAVSETYANRAMKVNEKCKQSCVAFLGTELATFDTLAKSNSYQRQNDGKIYIVYVGTLGHSYNLTSVIDALKILKDQGFDNLRLLVMGEGPLKKQFEAHALNQGIDTIFTGRLSYGSMVEKLCSCDIAVNPINKGAAQSIINKHGDYAAAGLPVINTQECLEYRNLLDRYSAGLNCSSEDVLDTAQKLKKLITDKSTRKQMGKNSRLLAEKCFDRATTYQEIVRLILNV